MFRDKIREILELVLKAEEKNIYVAYNYDTAVNLTKEVIRENMLDKAEKIGEKYNDQPAEE